MCDRNGIPVNAIALAVQSASPAPVRATCPRCGGAKRTTDVYDSGAVSAVCDRCGGVGTVPAAALPSPAPPPPSAPAYPGCSVQVAEVQEWAARHPVESIPGTALHLARLVCGLGDYPTAALVGRIFAQAMLALARLANAHGVRFAEVVTAEMRRIDAAEAKRP